MEELFVIAFAFPSVRDVGVVRCDCDQATVIIRQSSKMNLSHIVVATVRAFVNPSWVVANSVASIELNRGDLRAFFEWIDC